MHVTLDHYKIKNPEEELYSKYLSWLMLVCLDMMEL